MRYMNIKNTICRRSYKVYEIYFENFGAGWVSDTQIELVLVKNSRGKKWVFKIIMFYINCMYIIAMSGIMNTLKIRYHMK